MRDGVRVPKCAHDRRIDLMVDVMSNMALHVQAAEGYIKTGMTVSLDGTQDHFIVREAWFFWQELHMRAKINTAAAEVNEEVAAGRLQWNFHDVKRCIGRTRNTRQSMPSWENRGTIRGSRSRSARILMNEKSRAREWRRGG